MKKMRLKLCETEVSATIPDEATLGEAVMIVSGLLKSIGYCFDELMVVNKDD